MFQARPILRFVCRFVIVFGLLVAPWPGWQELYGRILRNSAAAILGAYGSQGIHTTVNLKDNTSVPVDFGSFGSKAIVAFVRNPTGDKTLDTIVYVSNREQTVANNGPLGSWHFSTRYLAYLPTAMVIALVLATNISWRRKLPSLGWALLLVHLFIAFQLGLMIIANLCADPATSQFEISPFAQKLVSALYESLVQHIGTNLAMAVPIWLLATFRRDDWMKLLGNETAGNAHAR